MFASDQGNPGFDIFGVFRLSKETEIRSFLPVQTPSTKAKLETNVSNLTKSKMGAETAILASTISSALSIATGIISRIKRYYERSDEQGCNPKCACMEHPILSDDHEIEITESMLSDTPVIIRRPQ